MGKTRLAIDLARHFHAPILSVDSRQMYRFMDIGTAKPSHAEREQALHYFIDVLDPDQDFSAGQFERDADELLNSLFSQHEVVIAAGGSTLYFDALWWGFDDMPEIPPQYRVELSKVLQEHGLEPLLTELEAVDPETFAVIDRRNPARVIRALEVYRATGKPISVFRQGRKEKSTPWRHIKIGLMEERSLLYERIDTRVEDMFAAGLVAEVEGLLAMGYTPDLQSLQTIGYREIIRSLGPSFDEDTALEEVQKNSRHYAKRQMTWFRRYPDIQWFSAGEQAAALDWAKSKMTVPEAP